MRMTGFHSGARVLLKSSGAAVLLALGMLLGAGSTAAAQTGGAVCTVKARAYPGPDAAMWQGLMAGRDGRVYTGLCDEGGSAHFYQYDPATDKNRMVADIATFLGERGKGIRMSSKIHNHPVEDSQGRVYFIPMSNGAGPKNIDYTSWRGGHVLRYNPADDTLEDLGLLDRMVGSYPLAIDRKRNQLFGIGYTGYLYRFDIEKRETHTLGRITNWDICRDIAVDDDGNCYGCWGISRIWRYDPRTDRPYDLAVQIPFDPTVWPTQLGNPMIDRAYIWRAVEWDPVDQAVYGVTCGSGSILFKYEPHVGLEGKVTELAQMCDPKFLEPAGRKDIPYSPLAFAVDSKNRRVYFVPSSRAYAIGSYAETFGVTSDHHLLMYDLKAGRKVDLGALRTEDGRRVFGCEAAAVTPDGTLYICGEAEIAAGEQSTRKAGSKTPTALHLLIYKPQL